jgi:tryprostatin B 6-hydroxylase
MHHLYFKKGEHHLHSVKYIRSVVPTFVALVIALTFGLSLSVYESTVTSTLLVGKTLVGLYTSLLVYGLFFILCGGF